MSRNRSNLPQLRDQLFLTDGGMETYLIFQQGIELPYFASFHLLQTPGRRGGHPRVLPRLC